MTFLRQYVAVKRYQEKQSGHLHRKHNYTAKHTESILIFCQTELKLKQSETSEAI